VSGAAIWDTTERVGTRSERPEGCERTILLVDDDAELCALMREYFAQQGLHLESVHDGPQGLARVLDGGFDLVLLDVMLPVMDGFEILRQIRRRSAVPVIMLTARTAERDRIAGLDQGADDYLPKPFGPDELLARIRAVLRRAGQPMAARPEVIESGEIKVNSQTREVRRNGKPVDLTWIEFDIFDLLVRSAGRVVSRDEIAAVLYQREATPYERSVDVHMSHLRRKLETEGRPLIRTVRGVGYMFSPAGKA
jgi:two-component system response regulator CpxR